MSHQDKRPDGARCRVTGAACIACSPVCDSRVPPPAQAPAQREGADGWRDCAGCVYWRPLSDRSGSGSWTGRRVCHYCLYHQVSRPRGAHGQCLAHTPPTRRRGVHPGLLPRRRAGSQHREVC